MASIVTQRPPRGWRKLQHSRRYELSLEYESVLGEREQLAVERIFCHEGELVDQPTLRRRADATRLADVLRQDLLEHGRDRRPTGERHTLVGGPCYVIELRYLAEEPQLIGRSRSFFYDDEPNDHGTAARSRSCTRWIASRVERDVFYRERKHDREHACSARPSVCFDDDLINRPYRGRTCA